jgi:hypothetical protein
MGMKSLHQETKDLLKAAQGVVSRRVIAAEAGVGYEWLQKFSQNKIGDPGVILIERLHRYLKYRLRGSKKRSKAA